MAGQKSWGSQPHTRCATLAVVDSLLTGLRVYVHSTGDCGPSQRRCDCGASFLHGWQYSCGDCVGFLSFCSSRQAGTLHKRAVHGLDADISKNLCCMCMQKRKGGLQPYCNRVEHLCFHPSRDSLVTARVRTGFLLRRDDDADRFLSKVAVKLRSCNALTAPLVCLCHEDHPGMRQLDAGCVQLDFRVVSGTPP